ncbi:MAG TPA: ribosomal protein S18-alanine N-acetyltransferase [Acidimicrobiales bacterium]|nr:ribosomal protein S18-alanine N-acetyltransferase [Acidimicrobiales bacterium]
MTSDGAPSADHGPDDPEDGDASFDPDGESVVGAVRIVPMRRRLLRSVLRIEETAYPKPWSATLFLSELSQRRSRRYTVATIGPLVVGYAGLMLVGEEGHVTTMTVDPAWQGRRIGTVLLLDLARSAPRLGVKHLTLEVRVANAPAQALYRRFGFAPVGVRKNYYSETGEDALVMWANDVDSTGYAERLGEIETDMRSGS